MPSRSRRSEATRDDVPPRSFASWGCWALVVAFVAVPVFAAVWVFWNPFARAAAEREARGPGSAIVAAMFRYRNEHGVFPLRLEELVPAHCPDVPPGWWLLRHPSRWQLRGEHATFTWNGQTEPPVGVWTFSRHRDHSERLAVETFLPIARPEAERLARAVRSARARIDRGDDHPWRVELHHRGLVSLLARAGRWSDAIAACERMRARDVGVAWATTALAWARAASQGAPPRDRDVPWIVYD